MMSAQPLRLHRAPDGRLLLTQGETTGPVQVRRCFPWASPNAWISLRDEEGAERLLVTDLEQLDADSREILQAELRSGGAPFEIVRILECRKEIELRCWRVETRQGPRSFQTELDEWPLRLPDGGVLIRDLAGDLYRVAEPDQLDPASRERLWVLLD